MDITPLQNEDADNKYKIFSKSLLLLLLRGKLKNRIVRVKKKKKVFIVSFGAICTGRNSFPDREEASTEQERNKYCISKTFSYQ